jgi:hypothetical protein
LDLGFSAFCDSLSSASLKTVATHWYRARGGRSMPGWADLQPQAIAAQLPLVWAYKYDSASGVFSARLAGDRISQLFGKSFRGLPLAEIQPPEAFVWVQKLYSRVVLEPAAHRCAGRVLKHLNRDGWGERLILPLSSDGVTGDGILGATEYRTPRGTPPAEALPETEAWFTLAPPSPGATRLSPEPALSREEFVSLEKRRPIAQRR